METLSIKKNPMMKKYLMVFLLTFSNIVYFFPYLASNFYVQFSEAYHITDGQLGNLMTYFGLTAVPGYFIGGWLADVFNPKKLVVASCISTALVGLGVVLARSYTMLLVLHLCYGITSTCLNWNAYLKVIRSLGDDGQQGRLYGSADIAYSLFNLILSYTVLALISTYLADHPMGFQYASLVYVVCAILIGIAIQIIVPSYDMSKEKKEKGASDRIKLDLVGKTMKMPVTWLIGLFTLGYFASRASMKYMNPYLVGVLGVSATTATFVTHTLRTASLLTMSPLGGALRDKIGGKSTPIAMTCSTVVLVSALVLAFAPMDAVAAWVIIVAYVLIIFASAMTTSFLYTPATEAKVSFVMTGTVLGIGSAIGYSSDLWLYSLCGGWLDKVGNGAYKSIWLITVGFGALMLISAYGLSKVYKKAEKDSAEEAAGN